MAYNWLEMHIIPAIITYSLSFIALLVGSLTDLKTREVPDWVNYGLIIGGIGLNLLFSVVYSDQFIIAKDITFNNQVVHQYIISGQSYLMKSLVGLVIFFGIAYIMFYAGQWGGGDSKMVMGLGAMIGIDMSFKAPQFLFWFFLNALFVGALYGLLWSIFLVFKNKQKFLKKFKTISSEKRVVQARRLMLVVLIFLLLSIIFIEPFYSRILILSLALIILVTYHMWIFAKAIEKSCMHKLVEPSKLTEGDWIVNDIHVDGKYITGPKELGVSKSQIRKLVQFYQRKKIKKILIKEGIPFVPSFLIAFIVTFTFGNPLMLLVRV